MECMKCGRTFRQDDCTASISGSILGDEHSDVYYLCSACGMYTVAQWWDNFTGEETVNLSGPLSRQEGDRQVALIRECDRPWDKKCRCATHRTYFRDTLD